MEVDVLQGLILYFGEWFLHHRSPDHMIKLAMQAGFPSSKVRVGKESEGVNLFMHLQV